MPGKLLFLGVSRFKGALCGWCVEEFAKVFDNGGVDLLNQGSCVRDRMLSKLKKHWRLKRSMRRWAVGNLWYLTTTVCSFVE